MRAHSPSGSERVPEVDVDVDGQLGRLPGLGETAEGPERLLQVGDGLAVGGPRHGPEPRLAEIGDRLLPQLPAQGVVGQPLDLLGDALGREPLDGLGDAGVQGALPLVEQAPVRDLVRERVLERVLEVREEPRLVEELRGLQVREPARAARPPARRRSPGAAAKGTSLPMTAAAWSRRLSSGASRSMRAARIACTVAGICRCSTGRVEPVGAALAGQGRRSPPGSGRSPRGRRDCPRSARSGAA